MRAYRLTGKLLVAYESLWTEVKSVTEFSGNLCAIVLLLAYCHCSRE